MEPPRRPSNERLDFTSPVSIEGTELQESVIISEVPAEHALTILRAYRLVLACARAEQITDMSDAARWEEEALLAIDQNPGFWAPVAVIAGEMCDPPAADPKHLAHACLVISEWALGHAAPATAVLFAEAAALVRPDDARYAYLTGRILQHRGRVREAERWLRRAMRVAGANGDEKAGALAARALEGCSDPMDG
jgi:hypothetical protein